MWGINILCIYLEWLNPVVGRREEFSFDFSSCTSTIVKLISHVAALEKGVTCLRARSCLFDLENQSVMMLFVSKIIA